MSRRFTFKRTGYSDVRKWKRDNEKFKRSIIDGSDGRVGYVYVFRLYDGFYKIGKTTNITERMKALQASCPTLNCVWSAHVRDMVIVEKELHKFFKKKKYEREVFMLEPKDIMEADRIADKYR
jgi:predicted GIY-YIG superfamily endonuclease